MSNYKSKFMEVIHHPDHQLLEFSWSEGTIELTDDDFMRELEQQVRSVGEYKPQFVLVDTIKFTFPISPDIQSWVDENVYPAWAKEGVKKMGFLMSKEFISQLSIEQAVQENSQEALKSGFFDAREKALAWYKED